jgi:hypothetical protein
MIAGRVVTFVLCLAGAIDTSAQTRASVPPACNGRDVTFLCANGACELQIEIVGKPGCRLRIDDDWLKAQRQPRITEGTALTLKVVGANLLRYALKFETKEKVVDSYVDLEKLWRQVLTLVPDSVLRADSGFVRAIKMWRAALVKHDSETTSFVASFQELTLTCGERDAIRVQASSVTNRLAQLEMLRREAVDAIEDSADFAVYDGTLAAHEATVNRLKTFETRGRAAADGFIRRVTFGVAGRIVTVTITMSDLASGSDAGVAEVVEFFVHSLLPVTFHAGYSYSSLDAFEFEQVRAAAGEDLFARINEGKTTSGFTAFLSYRVDGVELPLLRSDLFLSLGTDFTDPGKRLFIGATTRIQKLLLSAGIATASVRDADDNDRITDVVSGIGGVLGTRELFTRIRTTRQWQPFIALTFAPF